VSSDSSGCCRPRSELTAFQNNWLRKYFVDRLVILLMSRLKISSFLSFNFLLLPTLASFYNVAFIFWANLLPFHYVMEATSFMMMVMMFGLLLHDHHAEQLRSGITAAKSPGTESWHFRVQQAWVERRRWRWGIHCII